MQVKAETGTTTTLEVLAQEIQQMMDAWKSETYPDAWKYMLACGNAVTNPGYLVNPLGRYRHFAKTSDREKLAGMRREAQNFPCSGE